MIKKLLLVFFVVSHFVASAQDTTRTLSGEISGDMVLNGGDYLITSNIVVLPAARLIINKPTRLLFKSDVEILVYGVIDFKGSEGQLIELTSLDSTNEGIGLRISGDRDRAINLSYCRFSRLLRPLHFESEWYCNSVTISNCQFSNIITNQSALLVEASKKGEGNILFYFVNNSFVDNYANIQFDNLYTQEIQYQIKNNSFCNNFFVDNHVRYENNVLISKLSPWEKDFNKTKIINNAFIDNYCFSDELGAVISAANIGLIGSLETIDAPYNFWKSFNDSLPYLYESEVSPTFNTTPAFTTTNFIAPTFIVNNGIGDSIIDNRITILFSDTIASLVSSKPLLEFVYYDTATLTEEIISITDLEVNYLYANSGLEVRFPDSLLKYKIRYLKISNLKGDNGLTIPVYYLGYLNYLKDKKNYTVNYTYTPALENTTTVINPTDFKRSSMGVTIGVSQYFGDLSPSNSVDVFNARLYYGVSANFFLKKRFSLGIEAGYTSVFGSDLNSSDKYRRKRGLSFESNILSFAFTANYHIVSFQTGSTSPFFGTGIVGFYFNPTTTFNNTKYVLRNIGTEGQTASGGNGKYAPVGLGIPINIGVQQKITGKFYFAVQMQVVKTFTDHLDDVSGKYPLVSDVAAANPNLSRDIVQQLVDPSLGFGAGASRGNTDRKDWFSIIGVSLQYFL